jgi:hypothetical protein
MEGHGRREKRLEEEREGNQREDTNKSEQDVTFEQNYDAAQSRLRGCEHFHVIKSVRSYIPSINLSLGLNRTPVLLYSISFKAG